MPTQLPITSFFPSKRPINDNPTPFPALKPFTPPEKSSGPPPLTPYAPETINSWIYLNVKSLRKYQFEMVSLALYHNTLICLPTGLGKTFIGAMVILNYYRWFPKGKIFFLAPTRPLVSQQKKALNELHSINPSHILEITGELASEQREKLYETHDKRVFFMTPQTLENDLKDEKIDAFSIVLVIFDEAHRATGDYSYSNIIKLLERKSFGYRILALSASPGNKLEQVQQVINNLCISKLELRDENDEEIKAFLFTKEVIPCIVKENEALKEIMGKLDGIIIRLFKGLTVIGDLMKDKGFLFKCKEINRGIFMEIFEKFRTGNKELYGKYGKS